MSAGSTVTSGLSTALRLARGYPDSLVLMPGDRTTIIQSFWSIPLCLPSVICRLLMYWTDTGVPRDWVHLAGRELLTFVLGWLVFVEVTHRLAPLMGRSDQWGRFIAVWNWCNVIEGVLVVIGGLPGAFGMPAIFDQACELVMIGWALWLEWYATRLAFGIGRLNAVWLVLLDQSIGIVLASVAMAITS